ncbi:MAG TPA: DUF5615 family PIN-like protein [Pyrinomonadaceae bacterium]|nr:DUF5615 family PIN-like protein [Pyrinomonadaceae bacterium]
MKLLLDECVVHDLKRDLTAHSVVTAVEAGFGGLENGELLRAASDQFDVLITVDQNLRFQQDIKKFQIAVLVLISSGTTYPDLKALVPGILDAVGRIKPGELLCLPQTRT